VNPEIKQMWVDALLSGEYQQGYNYLASEFQGKVHYCCLGVLCDLAYKHHATNRNEDEFARFSYGKDSEYNNAILPPDVQAWAGLDDNNPELKATVPDYTEEEFEDTVRLSELNDDYGFSFKNLAKLIKEQL
jgi:hypothetical protein